MENRENKYEVLAKNIYLWTRADDDAELKTVTGHGVNYWWAFIQEWERDDYRHAAEMCYKHVSTLPK